MKNQRLKTSLSFGLTMFLAMLFSAVSTFAQATTGSVRGTVVDNAGSLVSGATVVIKNESTGIENTVVTNNDGIFEAPSLNPGPYTISVEASGFKRSVTNQFQVRLGIVNPIDVKLEAGNVAETVTITASADETLQTEQSQISTTFDSKKVTDLPSNGAGGGIDTLALLSPGVIANRIGGTNTNGSGLSVNGNRGRSNNFQIDGADNNDLSVGGPALFVNFQDGVQEFQVVTNNFDARYGRNQGAVVNIITKGGGNQFHGSGFLFHQDAAVLNSLDNISRRSGIEENEASLYNVFGGTFGGPVIFPRFGEGDPPAFGSAKDRAFFFVQYQGVRNPSQARVGSTSLAVFGTDLARLRSSFPGNAIIDTIAGYSPFAIPGAVVNETIVGTPISTRFNFAVPNAACPRAIGVNAPIPTYTVNNQTISCGTYTTYINPSTGQPFLTGGPYDTINLGTNAAPNLFQAAQFQRTLSTSYNENFYSIRFDVKATEKDNVIFRFLNQKSASENAVGSIAGGFTGDLPASSRNINGTWTHIFNNSILNEFRASYNKIGVEFGGGCEPTVPGCIPGPAQVDQAFANITFPVALGVTKTTFALAGIGPATNLPQGRIGKVYQFADNLNWLIGKHSLTIGAEFKYLDTLVPFLPNFNGTYTYNTRTRILNNAPSAVSITLGDPLLAFTEKDQYYFLQDDFKIRPNLTLNLGARYEYTGQPINALNEVTVARESNASTAFFNPALPLAQRVVPRVPSDKNNIAPRIGFAYSPKFWQGLFGDNQTVFRGGFSIAYDAAFYNILLNVQNAAPFSVALTIPQPSLPDSSTTNPAPIPLNPYGDRVRAAAAASGVLPRGVLNPIYLAQTTVAPDFRAPYSEQFSFGMQRQFGRKHIAEVRYVGTHGVGLFQNVNANFFVGPLVNGFSRPAIDPTTGTPTGPTIVFPSFANQLPSGTVSQVCINDPLTLDNEAACNGREKRQAGLTVRSNSSQSLYHSMQSRYNGRFLNDGLSLGLAYTFSKTIDDSSEIFGDATIGSPSAQNPFCINRCERALSALDRPHAFSASFTYELPYMKEQRGIVGRLIGGWQLNGTYILTSGSTYTPQNNIGGTLGLGATYLTAGDRPFYGNPNVDERLVGISQVDANLVYGVACNPAPCNTNTGFWSMNSINLTNGANPIAVTPNDVHYIINGPGSARIFGTPFGNVPRNAARGPIFNNLNMSVFKNIKVFERLRIQLRGEAFNVLNNPNPGFGVASGGFLPVIALTSAGVTGTAFGEFDDISYANRVVQVGLRIEF